MMHTVTGLFAHRASVGAATARLHKEGFAQERILIIDGPEMLAAHMDCSLRRKVLEDALFAALLSTFVFGLFGLMAGIGSLGMGAPIGWALGTAVVFALLGAGFGIFIGGIIGGGDAEQQVHLYQEGVRRGDVLLMVQAEEARTNKVMSILRQEQALGVQVCTRARTTSVLDRRGAGAAMAA